MDVVATFDDSAVSRNLDLIWGIATSMQVRSMSFSHKSGVHSTSANLGARLHALLRLVLEDQKSAEVTHQLGVV